MLCRILGEYLAFVDARDHMLGPRLVLDGFWEAWVTLAFARYMQPGFHCVDLHLHRDLPRIASFLHQLERSGSSLRFVKYDGDIAPAHPAAIVANPQQHWMLWLQK